MRKFVFYDSDPGGHVERDGSGQQYEDLLKSIFEYAYSFSGILSPYFKDDIAHWDMKSDITACVRSFLK